MFEAIALALSGFVTGGAFGFFLALIFRNAHPSTHFEIFDDSKRGEVVRVFRLTDQGREQIAVFPAFSTTNVRDLFVAVGAETTVVRPPTESNTATVRYADGDRRRKARSV